MSKITPQSGVLEVDGRLRVSDAIEPNEVITASALSKKESKAFIAAEIIDTTSGSNPRIIAIDTTVAYDVGTGLPKGKIYDSVTDKILGIATLNVANGSTGLATTTGVVSTNLDSTGYSINDSVYTDPATGQLTLSNTEKHIGYLLTIGTNAKVYINIAGEGGGANTTSDIGNYIADGIASNGNILTFTSYNDSSATPIDGSGGTVTATSLSKNLSSPLRTGGDWKFSKIASNAQGQGIAYDFDIELADTNKVFELEFNYKTSANFVNGDMGCYIYDKINANLISLTVVDIPQTNNTVGKFFAKFNSTSSTQYRLIFHVESASALAYDLFLDNISARESKKVEGPALGGWNPFPSVAAGTLITATTTNPTYGTVTQNVALWRRVADSMELMWDYRHTSIGTSGSGTYLFNLPPGYTIDTTKVPANTSVMQSVVGIFSGHYNNGANFYGLYGRVGVYSSTQLWVSYSVVGDGGATASARTLGSVEGFGSWANTHYSIRATIPISGWSSNINLIQNATEFAYNTNTANSDDTTSFGYGPDGVLFTNTSGIGILRKRVRFRSPIQITDKIEVEVWNGQGWQSLPHAADSVSGGVFIDVFRGENLNSANNYIGAGYRIISQTDVDVTFGKYAAGRSYTDITEWSDVTSSGFKWRVRKSSGSAVGEIPPFVGAKYSGTSAIALTANVTTHKFNTKEYDTYNAYNTTTGIYTIPLTGYYRITTSISVNAISTFYFWVNGVQRNSGESTAAGNYSATGSAEFYLNAGDTIDIRQDSNVSTVTSSFPNFSISKIG